MRSLHIGLLFLVCACSSGAGSGVPDGSSPMDASPGDSRTGDGGGLSVCAAPSGSETVMLTLTDSASNDKHVDQPWVGFNSEIVGDNGVVPSDSIFTLNADDLAPGAEAALGSSNQTPN